MLGKKPGHTGARQAKRLHIVSSNFSFVCLLPVRLAFCSPAWQFCFVPFEWLAAKCPLLDRRLKRNILSFRVWEKHLWEQPRESWTSCRVQQPLSGIKRHVAPEISCQNLHACAETVLDQVVLYQDSRRLMRKVKKSCWSLMKAILMKSKTSFLHVIVKGDVFNILCYLCRVQWNYIDVSPGSFCRRLFGVTEKTRKRLSLLQRVCTLSEHVGPLPPSHLFCLCIFQTSTFVSLYPLVRSVC